MVTEEVGPATTDGIIQFLAHGIGIVGNGQLYVILLPVERGMRSSFARLPPKGRKNMLLRDEEFDTLESLCYRSNLFACLSKNFGTEPKEIKNYLYGHGFVYSEKQKQFRPIGYEKVTR